MVVLVTASGEEHGLINVIGNSVKFDDHKHMEPKVKTQVEKERKNDARIVKARYMNSRGRNERLDKHYCRYAGDPIQKWHLIPGHTYDLPYGFIKEVNDKKTIKRSGLVSQDGVAVTQDESPLEKDVVDPEALHQLYPVDF
jgi:hypothetical protein